MRSKFVALTVVLLSASAALAQPTELVVPEDGTQTIAPGQHNLKRLEIRKNGTLKFSGSTSIMATTFVAQDGATIAYENSTAKSELIFNIYTLDASGVKSLNLDGDGKNGTGYNPGQHAAAGNPGAGAKNCRFRDPDGSKAGAGGPGTSGAHGTAGEDAVDFALYLPKLSPGASIKISAVGGDGGRGQDGGPGGAGGGRSNCHDGRNGGSGGAGGNGGKGGDTGKTLVFVVVPDPEFSDDEKKKLIAATTKIDFNVGRGTSGPRGKGGGGGQPGRGAIVGGSGLQAGADGPDGNEGPKGEGPLATDRKAVIEPWARVEIISQQHYAQFMAQKIAQGFPQ